ncbi:MAG TPA: mechanosensitive ion channel [Opitutales bacterium]|nr:mechanosensitive ion channel [Opitutales bacterium]
MAENSFLSPFLEKLGSFMPNAFAAAIVLIIGIILAGLLRKGAGFLLSKLKVDERINKERENKLSVETPASTFIYYLALLYVLLLVLSILGVEEVLLPLQDMFHAFAGYIPNLIAAGVIGFAGYIIARIVSVVVGTAAKGLDALGSKLKLADNLSLSKLAQQLVFLFIFVPILIVALDTLEMAAISEPATGMLNDLMAAIPGIIGAAIILAVFFIAGKFVVSMLVELLKNLGADKLPEKLGLKAIVGDDFSLSKLTGNVAFFFIMFTAVISALEKLEMVQIAAVLENLLVLAGQIVLGLVILAVGNFFANLAHQLLSKSEGDSTIVASVARYAILALVLAIGLHAMGIAEDIVLLAFGLSLGSVAVAVALSFGLGGREAAGKHMEYLLGKFRKDG